MQSPEWKCGAVGKQGPVMCVLVQVLRQFSAVVQAVRTPYPYPYLYVKQLTIRDIFTILREASLMLV